MCTPTHQCSIVYSDRHLSEGKLQHWTWLPVVLEDKVEREKIRAAEDQQKQKRLCNEPVVKKVSHQPTRSNPTFYHKNKRHTIIVNLVYNLGCGRD